jgi:hypothetical protein
MMQPLVRAPFRASKKRKRWHARRAGKISKYEKLLSVRHAAASIAGFEKACLFSSPATPYCQAGDPWGRFVGHLRIFREQACLSVSSFYAATADPPFSFPSHCSLVGGSGVRWN